MPPKAEKPEKAEKTEKPAPAETPAKTPAQVKQLEAAIAHIAKTYGEGSIMRLGDERARVQIPVVSTGSLAIDLALGIGGVPRGRIVEIYGPEMSGKTTLVLQIIAEAQRNNGLAAFIDAEHALDPNYARKLGVKLDDLLVSQPDSGEEALQICETLVRSNALDVIAIDSVAALVPKAELEGQMGDAIVGVQARLMSQAMRKLTSLVAKAQTCVIFTNQLREKIGVMFGNPETTPGGKALKFYASVRMDLRRQQQIKDPEGRAIGNHCKVKIVKNKCAPPFAECEFDVMFNEGISKEGSILDVATNCGVVEKKGSWLQFAGEMIGQGRESAKDFLKQNPAVADKIVAAVKAKAAGSAPATEAPEPKA
ncbi:MAG: recombinase RecA [Verrucomicrobia bacterium]|nr:recombinase RecA [Verrucomicrobiota bacterium]